MNTPAEMAACPGCGQAKPLEDFPRDRSRKNGRMSRCRECDNARSRRYYQQNSERVLARIAARPKPPRVCLHCENPATSQRHWFCDTCRAKGARRNRPPDTPAPPPLDCPTCGPPPSIHVDDINDTAVERWIADYLAWSGNVSDCTGH